jgi:hypothetical protein
VDLPPGQRENPLRAPRDLSALLAATTANIYRRLVEEIRGIRWLRSEVALVHFTGTCPVANFAFGRKGA